jgi:pimeloyl-ACP methyl ester carboxylesterase
MRQRLLDIEGHQLVALASNEDKPGTPIVFLHGITTSLHFWMPNLPERVKQHVHWYSLSLPGHYPATLPRGFRRDEVTPQMFARVLTTAIRELVGNQPVALVGHSTGGFAALNIAAQTPEVVKSVLCISGFSKGRWKGLMGFLQKLSRSGSIGILLFKANFRAFMASKRLYGLGCALQAADRQAYFASPVLDATIDAMYLDAVKHDLDALVDFFNRIADIDISSLLPRIEAPTLIVTGDRDPVIPYEHARFMAECIPNAELAILEGAGHMFFAERTDAYHRLLTQWIACTVL